jgi:hypothetical protein
MKSFAFVKMPGSFVRMLELPFAITRGCAFWGSTCRVKVRDAVDLRIDLCRSGGAILCGGSPQWHWKNHRRRRTKSAVGPSSSRRRRHSTPIATACPTPGKPHAGSIRTTQPMGTATPGNPHESPIRTTLPMGTAMATRTGRRIDLGFDPRPEETGLSISG